MDTRKPRAWLPSKDEVRVSEMARREADRQARRVRWERLLEARKQYIEWSAFSMWVRVIVASEGEIPPWLSKILEGRCPGFLADEWRCRDAHLEAEPLLGRRLVEWIENNLFGIAKREGWLQAVTFYAVRDPAFLQDFAYFQYCERRWKRQRPSPYPSFEEWRRDALQSTGQVLDACEMREETRQIIKASRSVSPQRLADAVPQYVDWEAFTYWARSLLEADTILPVAVVEELQRRCPGFLECDHELRRSLPLEAYTRRWRALLEWGEHRFFTDAKQEGWFDVLVFYARAHPRSVRTVDYWVFYWDAYWSDKPLDRYPSFQRWREAADDYFVESEDK